MEAIKMIPAVVMALVVAGLVVTAGVKVIANFRSNAIDNIAASSISNETYVASTTTVTPNETTAGCILTTLTRLDVVGPGLNSSTITSDVNASTGYFGSGSITIPGNVSGNTTYLWYSFKAKDDVLNATVDSMKGTTEISNQFTTIGIVVAMVVILMMIGGLAAYFALR